MSVIITDLVLDSCDRHPDSVALISGRERLSYLELGDRVRTASSHLVERGMGPGQRVLFAVRPGVEALVLVLAIARTGATIVFVDPGMSHELLRARIVGRVEWACAESVVYAVSGPGLVRRIAAWRGLRLPDIAKLADRHVIAGPWLPFGPPGLRSGALRKPAVSFAMPKVAADGDALVIYTSGTTGAPKGVVHSHAGLVASMDVLVPLLATGPGDVFYTSELHTALPALLSGATVALPPAGESPTPMLTSLARTGATCCYFVPVDLSRLLDRLEATGGQLPVSLRTVILGSAPVTSGLLHRLYALAPHIDVWCVYAMTEMLPVCVISGVEKLAWGKQGDLVGQPVHGVRVDVAANGVLQVAGPHLCRSYQGQPEHHRVSTGDMGMLDDGRVVLLGRAKDMIIRGRHNVYPGLYEDALGRIDGVDSVKMVGLPDAGTGDEEIVLAVQPSAGQRPESVWRRVEAVLGSTSSPVDEWARPDRIVVMQLPRSGRSRKVDVAKLRVEITQRQTLRTTLAWQQDE